MNTLDTSTANSNPVDNVGEWKQGVAVKQAKGFGLINHPHSSMHRCIKKTPVKRTSKKAVK